MKNRTYNGWKNYASWNCSLWLNNEERYYRTAVEFMRTYAGKRPYIDFIERKGFSGERTPDNIKWNGQKLDYKSLDAMMWELSPEGARYVQ